MVLRRDHFIAISDQQLDDLAETGTVGPQAMCEDNAGFAGHAAPPRLGHLTSRPGDIRIRPRLDLAVAGGDTGTGASRLRIAPRHPSSLTSIWTAGVRMGWRAPASLRRAGRTPRACEADPDHRAGGH